MPTVQPSPPTIPVSPPAPPMNPHHAVPKMTPLSVPGSTPAPSPAPAPGPVPVIILIGTIIETVQCPTGREVPMRKPRKQGDEKKRRRQRPCPGGGKPRIEVKQRRRKIGRFWLPKLWTRALGVGAAGGGKSASAVVESRTRLTGYRAGYRGGSGVRIVSELDKARTPTEAMISLMMGEDICWFQVYAIEPRRECTCPDGSKCRSTTRRD